MSSSQALGFIKTKVAILISVIFIGLVTTAGILADHYSSPAEITTVNSQTTDVKYVGVNGQNALDLLKKYAVVQTKHYSFGDLVVSINGTPGTGPKYWSFYVNGKLSAVGASSYTTKSTDNIEWKLQSLR